MKAYASEMVKKDSVFRDIAEKQETLWLNNKYLPFDTVDALCQLVVSDRDIEEAEKRLERFAPYIMKCFPETRETNGIIESPLVQISAMQRQLEKDFNTEIPGQLLLKTDSHLAIAGSVKARGGIYEVLKHAEDLAYEAGLLTYSDNYEKLADKEYRDFFSKYTVQVGSTGNLGLSIGIMSAAIGFKVKVHMSADAKQWKKDLLRSKGVEVIEYDDDYSKAVAEGRRLSDEDPMSYFVDDEYSVALFLGYAVAAKRLQKQLEGMNIPVDGQHPLIVYIPCGVGGAPGGILYGLKRIFKDNVHVFFCEPVLFPSVLIGMSSDLYEKANVADFDIHGMSEADGLACASPSGFVTRIDRNLLSGDFTIQDEKLYTFMRMLIDTENVRIEPSSCAAFIGPVSLTADEKGLSYLAAHSIDNDKLNNAAQICWATGGKLVPEEVWKEYLNK
ncbi:MAG: D-serine ammonia-lyase [Schwartzia sp.]|nr:D-serine ammonia-lyase [Schwartzia sp. (in: firmicutes)]